MRYMIANVVSSEMTSVVLETQSVITTELLLAIGGIAAVGLALVWIYFTKGSSE